MKALLNMVFGMFAKSRRTSGHTGLFTKFYYAKELPHLTEYLVQNPMFRHMAVSFHNKKTNLVNDIDKQLEKNLLTPEQYDAIYNKKRID